MVKNSKVEKVYPYPTLAISAAINDIIELQKGIVTFYDSQQGQIHFTVEMYGFLWEYRFTVHDIGNNKSSVTLEVTGRDAKDPTEKATNQLALLDSILPLETRTA